MILQHQSAMLDMIYEAYGFRTDVDENMNQEMTYLAIRLRSHRRCVGRDGAAPSKGQLSDQSLLGKDR